MVLDSASVREGGVNMGQRRDAESGQHSFSGADDCQSCLLLSPMSPCTLTTPTGVVATPETMTPFTPHPLPVATL